MLSGYRRRTGRRTVNKTKPTPDGALNFTLSSQASEL
jgi:hypothetical protein